MLSVLTFATLLTHVTATLNITFCSDTHCKAEPLGHLQLSKPTGCLKNFAGQALGLKVNPVESTNSTNKAIRFYRSTDCFGHCGSGHLISQMSHGFQRPVGSTMQSFELVDLDENGDYPPHGYCGIRHGDAQFFRGRTWKWQQIGDGAFREIPIEEWDDELFPKQTGQDYDLHGSVDSMGKEKMRQVRENAWHGVFLEDWDEEVHFRQMLPPV